MIIDAILKINPNAKVTVYGRDIDTCTFDWHVGNAISKEDIKDKLVEVQAEYDAKQYQRDRKEAYPSIEDQLDDIYHNGIDGWKATIKAIKDANPKT